MNYSDNDIIAIAKRDNNTKRSFLLVNPLQGKHIPVSPAKTFALVKELSIKVFSENSTENILVVGFAETATAIGAILASFAPFSINYIHTTREVMGTSESLFFSEEHSHATEQKLIRASMDQYLTHNTRIIFAEDEVTTGRTIENVISVLLKTYPTLHLKFGIASILNGMSEDKIAELKRKDISCHFILPVPNYDYDAILSEFVYVEKNKIICENEPCIPYNTVEMSNYPDPRLCVNIQYYVKQCDRFSKLLYQKLGQINLNQKKILIIGTEECMYPGLYFGNYLEKSTTGSQIRFHATTRSPILPCDHENYPLKCRYQLTSFYNEDRTTFIYNLSSYDYVFIITDAVLQTSGMNSLCQALNQNQCSNITKIVWRS